MASFFKPRKKKPFRNFMGKGKNAGKQHFLFIPQCFFLYFQKDMHFSRHKEFVVCKINTFNLDKFKILSSGKGLSVFPSAKESLKLVKSEHST